MSRQHFFDWFATHSHRLRFRTSHTAIENPHRRPLRVEPLEHRRMLAVLAVNSDLDNLTSGDGLVTLREAIIAANTDAATDLGEIGSGADVITFDADLFGTPQTISLLLGEIEITEALTVDGPGAALLSIDAQENSRIFNITATTGDFAFAGLTLTGGKTTAAGGGAIRSRTSGNLTIDQSTVSGNSTVGHRAEGGGIRSSGDVTLTNSSVSDNSTSGGYSAYGGGISADGGVTVTGSTVSGNSTSGTYAYGGGISSGGNVTLTNSTVSGNSTSGTYVYGGGIYTSGADVTLTGSTVSGNSTSGVNSDGGGIGALGSVTISQSTVTNNHALGSSARGGGIWTYNDLVTFSGSIVAGNTASGGNPDLRPGTGTLGVDYSLIGDTSDLTAGQLTDISAGMGNLLNVDPLLAPLANNGGFILPDGSTILTHALVPGSPAIDAGDSEFASPPQYDQRGTPFERVSDGRIDMGAYEYQSTSVNDNPVITSPATANVAENTQPVHTLTATDADLPAQTVTFSISGSGADNAKFEIVGNELRFIAAPDFENPTDLGGTAGDNVYEVSVLADDGNGGTTPQTILVTVDDVTATIAGRHIFYENSFFDDPDGDGPLSGVGANASDDGAIAPDKNALLPGELADFANYTSYSRGINAIMVGIAGLVATPTLATIGDFFEFRVGNDNTFASPGWSTAPDPLSVDVRLGDGEASSDRITIIWADNVIEKQWLEVTVLANANTELTVPEVHFWGNAIGETGNQPSNADVSALDQAFTRDNFTTFLNPPDITNPYDFNRDHDVSAIDQAIARDNFTTFLDVLQLISPPAGGSGSGGNLAAAFFDGSSSEVGTLPSRGLSLQESVGDTMHRSTAAKLHRPVQTDLRNNVREDALLLLLKAKRSSKQAHQEERFETLVKDTRVLRDSVDVAFAGDDWLRELL